MAEGGGLPWPGPTCRSATELQAGGRLGSFALVDPAAIFGPLDAGFEKTVGVVHTRASHYYCDYYYYYCYYYYYYYYYTYCYYYC